MSPLAAFDLLVVGDCNPDLLLVGGDLVPEFGQREQLVDRAVLTIGGSASITACGAARLGLSTALVAAVGRDHFGDTCSRTCLRAGSTCRGARAARATRPASPSSSRAGDDRAILTSIGAIAALTGADVDLGLLRAARHLHIASYFLLHGLRAGLPARRGCPRCRRHRLARPAGRSGRELGVRAARAGRARRPALRQRARERRHRHQRVPARRREARPARSARAHAGGPGRPSGRAGRRRSTRRAPATASTPASSPRGSTASRTADALALGARAARSRPARPEARMPSRRWTRRGRPLRVILCVAANPSIDRLFTVERLVPGSIHRPAEFAQVPGGKGLNVARAARRARRRCPGCRAPGRACRPLDRRAARG